MMYPFIQLDDSTEIVHSEMLDDGEVKVYVEKPDEIDGFHNAVCFLPEYRWEDVHGFTESEIIKYQEIIESVAHLIIEFSQNGGFENASNF
ncbi:MAG: hypothetical protein HFE63_02045 [Clostridiales bacterium]|nr:hypothetical protein [Clostridiales bacterium]